MHALMIFLHLAAAVAWLGGMLFMVAVLRPALGTLEPPARLKLVAAVLGRFFAIVTASIVLIAASGAWMVANADAPPRGWLAMGAIGVAMMLVFAVIVLGPWRQLKDAAAREAWPAAGAAATAITRLAQLNLVLGTAAVAVVLAWH